MNKLFKSIVSFVLAITLCCSMLTAFAAEPTQGENTSTSPANEMLDDWFDVFLRDHSNEQGEVVGKSTYRWSDKWFETSANESKGEPRETDFWLSAIVFETLNDALEYGADQAYKEKVKGVMDELYKSFVESKWHPTWDVHVWQNNDYNDDLCWWSMALLRAHELTGEQKYFDLSKQLFDTLYEDWDETPGFGGEPYGGITWRRSLPIEQATKNMCANGNSSLVASRFAQYYKAKGDTENAEYYGAIGKKIYDWLHAHLYKGNGKVIDNINFRGKESASQFTYNYGVCAGAAFEMYNLTGEQEYLDTAIEVMQAAFDQFTPDGLTITDEGTGDSAGFKTIMLRVAADMCYNGGVEQFEKYLVANAYQAWNHRRESDGLVGSNLRFTPREGVRQCSPCAALGPSLLYWTQFDPNGDYDFDFSGSDIPGRYEAELAESYNMTFTSSQDNARPTSGTAFTWYWNPNDRIDGWIEFEVDAPVSGTYNLDICWYTRMDNSRRMSVNGAEDITVNFKRSKANTWEIKTIAVDLDKGKNTIRFTYRNPRVHGDGDRDQWLFIDYIQLCPADDVLAVTTDSDEYKTNDDVTFTILTNNKVNRIALANESDRYLSKTSESHVDNGDGTITWTITTSFATKGDRVIKIYTAYQGELLIDSGVTASFKVDIAISESDEPVSVISVSAIDSMQANDVFTVTVKTPASATKIGFFDSVTGKALGKVSQSYVDKMGVRTWTIALCVGSKGDRSFDVKATDKTGVWSEAQKMDIVIY